jgi:two-component system, OmpR family, sensor histidine kinase SenX3
VWWQAALVLLVGVAIGLLVGVLRREAVDPAGHDAAREPAPAATPAEPVPATAPAEPANSPQVPQPVAQPTAEATATATAPDPGPDTPPPLAPQVEELIRELPGIVIVVDGAGIVRVASEPAVALRLVRRQRLASTSLMDCVTATLAAVRTSERNITIRRPPLRKGQLELRVRGIPLSSDIVLLLMDDLTEEHRVAAIRRDFIANVSHELKTPVGAVSLLAEAIVAARDDPEAVQHFASRMQAEAERLTSLINDVIDLSRLQGDDPMSHASVVSVDDIVAAAIDFIHAAAEAKNIQIVVGGRAGEKVFGDATQLQTALRNVLANAVVYSEPNTRVALAVRESDALIEIDVKDQGIGIPEKELDRIFERFYRVDEARSRVTGGTGLGLSIVRNVCRNHGGDVLVWSVQDEGSTFTLQLPKYTSRSDQESYAFEETT